MSYLGNFEWNFLHSQRTSLIKKFPRTYFFTSIACFYFGIGMIQGKYKIVNQFDETKFTGPIQYANFFLLKRNNELTKNMKPYF